MTTPAPASPQTTESRLIPQAVSSTARQNGVYVPAMSTKIMEWSRRFMMPRSRGFQVMRW